MDDGSWKVGIVVVVVVLAFLAASGCAITKVNVNPIGAAIYPAKNPDQVQLFYEKPTQPFTEIAIVDSLSYITLGDALNHIRAAAAKAGADAVIIRDTGAGYGFVTVIGSAIVFQK